MRPISFKHRRRYGGATPAMGLHRRMRSVETLVQLSFGWTHEDLWLRVYRKSVVAVPVEVAPRAQRCRVRGQSAFDRIRQPQSNYLSRLSIYILYEVVGGDLRKFYYTATLQQANFITRLFTRYIDELNSLSAIRAFIYLEAQNISRQTAKFRIKKDPRRSWCHQYLKTVF